jgi:SP family facilitated glucose transporter-like MFS transporter 9
MVLTMNRFLIVFLGRFIIGIAIGITSAVIPTYLSKISSKRTRGVICSLHSLGIVIGISTGYIFSYMFNSLINWRIPFIIFSVTTIVHIPFLVCIISPKNNSSQREIKATTYELITAKNSKKSILTSILIHMGQQFTCITGVIYNSDQILKKEKNPDLKTIYVSFVSIISTVCAIFIVDRLGRKILLESSCIVCSIALLLLIYSGYKVFSLFLFMIGFNLGLGPIAWFITGEIFPSRYSKIGTTISVTANWLSNFFISLTFPFLMEKFGENCYWIYIISMFSLLIYMQLFFRETKGKIPDFQ